MIRAVIMLLAPTWAVSAGAAPAHEHGTARLSVAIDGADLVVRFGSPLDNLVGFERPPRNARERETLAIATSSLGDPSRVVVPSPGARCTVTAAEVVMPFTSDSGKHPHASDPGHADASAEWHFHCAEPAALTGIDLPLFGEFRGLRRLDVQWAGPRGQGSAVLSAKRRQLLLQ